MLGCLQLEPQQLHVYMYCWRLRGGSIEPVEPPPRYGPGGVIRITDDIWLSGSANGWKCEILGLTCTSVINWFTELLIYIRLISVCLVCLLHLTNRRIIALKVS